MNPTGPLLADVITIPTEVHRGEFVVSLEDGLTHADAVLGTYVVTEQVADAFSQALGLVANAVDTRASRAAFLHASFVGGRAVPVFTPAQYGELPSAWLGRSKVPV